jgi:hypothetical protein
MLEKKTLIRLWWDTDKSVNLLKYFVIVSSVQLDNGMEQNVSKNYFLDYNILGKTIINSNIVNILHTIYWMVVFFCKSSIFESGQNQSAKYCQHFMYSIKALKHCLYLDFFRKKKVYMLPDCI